MFLPPGGLLQLAWLSLLLSASETLLSARGKARPGCHRGSAARWACVHLCFVERCPWVWAPLEAAMLCVLQQGAT